MGALMAWHQYHENSLTDHYEIAAVTIGGNSLDKVISQRSHDAMITSFWRQNDVATSLWPHNDVIFASCVRLDASVNVFVIGFGCSVVLPVGPWCTIVVKLCFANIFFEMAIWKCRLDILAMLFWSLYVENIDHCRQHMQRTEFTNYNNGANINNSSSHL